MEYKPESKKSEGTEQISHADDIFTPMEKSNNTPTTEAEHKYASKEVFAELIGVNPKTVDWYVERGDLVADENGNIDIAEATNKKFIQRIVEMEQFEPEHLFVNKSELARMLGVTPPAVIQYIEKGRVVFDENFGIDIKDPTNRHFIESFQKGKRKESAQNLVTIPELAERMGISIQTVYRKINEGKLIKNKDGKIDLNNEDNAQFVATYKKTADRPPKAKDEKTQPTQGDNNETGKDKQSGNTESYVEEKGNADEAPEVPTSTSMEELSVTPAVASDTDTPKPEETTPEKITVPKDLMSGIRNPKKGMDINKEIADSFISLGFNEDDVRMVMEEAPEKAQELLDIIDLCRIACVSVDGLSIDTSKIAELALTTFAIDGTIPDIFVSKNGNKIDIAALTESMQKIRDDVGSIASCKGSPIKNYIAVDDDGKITTIYDITGPNANREYAFKAFRRLPVADCLKLGITELHIKSRGFELILNPDIMPADFSMLKTLFEARFGVKVGVINEDSIVERHKKDKSRIHDEIDIEFNRHDEDKSFWISARDPLKYLWFSQDAKYQYFRRDLINLLCDESVWGDSYFRTYHARMRFIDRVILKGNRDNYKGFSLETREDIAKTVKAFDKAIAEYMKNGENYNGEQLMDMTKTLNGNHLSFITTINGVDYTIGVGEDITNDFDRDFYAVSVYTDNDNKKK